MLQFSVFDGYCDISHFITTRHGGVSEGCYATMNPGEHSGDVLNAVRINRKLLSEEIGITPERLFTPYQVHEAEVYSIETAFLSFTPEERQLAMQGKDALITNLPNVCIAVATADCVPVLVYAPDKKVVAAIHAGWRGTVKQIVAKTIRKMSVDYACDPEQMIAGIAPSISLDAFEVGEEVVESFRMAGMDMDRVMRRNPETGKAHLDLWETNRLQLLEAGLQPQRIEVSGICTYAHSDDFFSARRLGIKSGRMLSGIRMKEEYL